MNTMVTYYVLYDLMMVCNDQGTVIAASAVDKNGNPVDSKFLIGKNFSREEWFHSLEYVLVRGVWNGQNDEIAFSSCRRVFGTADFTMEPC